MHLIFDNKTNFTSSEREKLASEGLALPDGSFPIRNKQDLKDAVKSIGLAKSYDRAKRWIVKRARDLNALDLLPDKWKIKDSQDSTMEYDLNSLLAEEYFAGYQYFHVIPFLVGKERPSIQKKFQEFAEDELNDHAVKLINRLSELQMQCWLTSPQSWYDYSQSSYLNEGTYNTLAQLSLNKIAETNAILHYQEVIVKAESYKDFTTAELLKDILADEETHLSDINDFINDFSA